MRHLTKNLLFAIIAANIDSSLVQGIMVVQSYAGNMHHYQEQWLKDIGMTEAEALQTGKSLHHFQLVGTIVGNMVSLLYAKLFGRKGGLLMNTFISIFSALFSGHCKYFSSEGLLYLGRILMGLKVGNGNVLCPMYLMEITPIKIRGALAATYELGVTIGIGIGLVASRFLPNQDIWPIMYSLNSVPALLALVMLPYCPESPRFLYVVKGNELEARKAYTWLRGGRSFENEIQMLKDMRKKVFREASMRDMLTDDLLRSSLMLCIVLSIAIELSGFHNMLSYIYEYQRELMPGNEDEASLITDYFIFWSSMIGCLLGIMVLYYFGRKVALISGFCILVIFYIVICGLILFDKVLLIIPLYVCWFITILAWKIGIVSMALVMPTLVFSTIDAPYGYAISKAIGTTTKLIYQIVLYSIQKRLHGFLFLNYAIANIAFAYYTWKRVPETKNQTYQSIQNQIEILHNISRSKKADK